MAMSGFNPTYNGGVVSPFHHEQMEYAHLAIYTSIASLHFTLSVLLMSVVVLGEAVCRSGRA